MGYLDLYDTGNIGLVNLKSFTIPWIRYNMTLFCAMVWKVSDLTECSTSLVVLREWKVKHLLLLLEAPMENGRVNIPIDD